MMDPKEAAAGTRIAAYLARAGLGSRRSCEVLVQEGRITVNGKQITHPSQKVTPSDIIMFDGEAIRPPEHTRVWRYHKPKGVICSRHDPQGRPTIFAQVEPIIGHCVSVGRLDFNTEGLVLLTNNGAFARHLELPANGWIRRYRVRAYGPVTQAKLTSLADGVKIDDINYGGINALIDSRQGANLWVSVSIKEGKNREIRKIFAHLDCQVSRLIRTSYGAFQLGKLPEGTLEEIPAKMLREQLGAQQAKELGIP